MFTNFIPLREMNADLFKIKTVLFLLYVVKCCLPHITYPLTFLSKHEKHFKDEADKEESIKLAIAMQRKQSSVFTNVCVSKNQATKESYKIIKCVAKHGKTYSRPGMYKRGFLSC